MEDEGLDAVLDEPEVAAAAATPIAATPSAPATPPPAQPVLRRPTEVPPPAAPTVAAAAASAAAVSDQPAAVQPTAPPPVQPVARQPTADVATQRPRPSVDTPRRVAQPGDLICANCQEPNDPTRKFCRRCGSSLATAAPAVTIPWYRRMFQGKPKTYEAGERKQAMRSGASPRRGVGTRLRFIVGWALAGLVVLGAIGYVAVPSVGSAINGGLRGAINAVGRIVSPTLVLVHADSTDASDAIKDHQAAKVTDGATNSDWQADGRRPTLTFTFERPIDIGALNLWNGAADPKTKALRTDLRRPSQLVLTTQSGQEATIDLDDIHDRQVRYVDLSAVEELVIEVRETNGPDDAPVSLSEIEFLRKS
jgi:hypothetical protein